MKYYLVFLSICVLLNSKTINEETIIITFASQYDQYISDNDGYFFFKSNYKDSNDVFDSDDIEEKTSFEMEILILFTNPLRCKFWKGEEKYIFSICNLKGGLKRDEIITISNYKYLEYKGYNVKLEFNTPYTYLYKISSDVPFLYSDIQKFNIQENHDNINLRFQFESYNNEPLVIINQNKALVPLENCKTSGKILNCEILKEKLDKVSNTNNTYQLRYYHDILGSKFFSSTGNIYILIMKIPLKKIYI